MNYFRLTVAYDGSDFCGWQVQANGPTIQGAFMEAGKKFIKSPFTITGCSRTDSGVHALNYTAVLAGDIPMKADKVLKAFNAHLPSTIVVRGCQESDESFHPRYSAKTKHYRYTIYNGAYPVPQYMHYSYFFRYDLDHEAMNLAAESFVGSHDFVAFSSVKTTVDDTVRCMDFCQVTRQGDYIYLDVIGDGFLYNMVRIMAGTLIEVGRGKMPVGAVGDILASRDRLRARWTAPANGLTLVEVTYTEEKELEETR